MQFNPPLPTVQPSFSSIRCKTFNLSILTCYSSPVIAAMVTRRPPDFFSSQTPIPSPPSPNSSPRRSLNCFPGVSAISYPLSLVSCPLSPCPTIPLRPLECALPDKHRVLPVFSRNRPPSSPLEATLTRMLISVHSKELTWQLSPLESALTRKRGVGVTSLQPRAFLSPHPTLRSSTFQRSDAFVSPIAAERPWCNNWRWHKNCSRSEETTPLPSVSKDSKRTSVTALVRRRTGLQVVPGSIVLKVDRLAGWPERHPFRVLATFRVGKAGSVRLG